MEIVIPPRDHGGSVYRYAYDENGDVISSHRLAERIAEDLPRRGRGRQTVQWPFQSIVSEETEASGPTILPIPIRRSTWQPPPVPPKDDDSIWGPLDKTIIPDYVVNFLNGETPETLAVRKQTGDGRTGQPKPEAPRRGHQQRPSRVVEFEAFVDADSQRTRSSTASSLIRGSEEDILPSGIGGGEKGSSRGIRRLAHGWRGGVALNALLCFLIMTVGFVALILVVSKSQMLGGESIVYQGACTAGERVSWGIHALVAIMAIVLMAGANYVFQVLSAPTRPEVAAAHDMRRWLDIGIPSVRNWAYISSGRVFLSVAILVAAVVTQVIYNSIIFTTQYSVDSKLVFVTQSFLSAAPFSNATSNNAGSLDRTEILGLQSLAIQGGLTNLSATDCLQEFAGAFETNFATLLVITSLSSPGSSLVQTAAPGQHLSQFRTGTATRPALLPDSALSYCLAQRMSSAPQCTVALNASLLVIVALLNLITVICTAGVLSKSSFEPLVTLGDALASFLSDADPTTRDACLMSKTDVWQGRWGFREAKYWQPRTHYWFGTPSLPRWLFASALWWVLAGAVAAALGVSFHNSPAGQLSPFGRPSPHTLLALPSSAAAAAVAVLASLPQLLLAALYLAANSLLSTLFLSHEASLFALAPPRPLRVSSSPHGAQTTSLYLTLPRPCSWALMLLFAAMSFTLRQAVLVIDVRPHVPLSLGEAAAATAAMLAPPTRAVGFSGVALAVLLAQLALLATLVLGLGCRAAPAAPTVRGSGCRAHGGNPLALPAGSCSAVLAARCHRGPGEADVARRKVRWGVTGVNAGTGVAHCTFSARGVGEVDLARCYA